MMGLHEYVANCHGRAFELGRFDGAQFVLGWLELMGNGDFGAPFKDRYSSLKEGFKALRQEGFESLSQLAEANLTLLPSWTYATPGDVAIIGTGRAACAGVVGTGGIIHIVSPAGGMDFIELEQATEVFHP